MSATARAAAARPERYWQAINRTLAEELEHDPTVVLFGQNVARSGGTFGSTRGLQERFGEGRVRDTPISEQAAVGAAVGAAMFGLRPVVELVFSDFLLIALDQLVNQAAKLRYFSGGSLDVPLVVKTGVGVGFGMGAQHAQSLEGWLAHIPGLKVVWPSSARDAAGLLRAAIRDPGPVVYLESVGRYAVREVVDPEPIAIGSARTVREGDDLTLVSWGTAVATCLTAAEQLDAEGVGASVIDLRSLQPWDVETVVASVRRTGRALVVHDATRAFGPGGEIASELGERCFDVLRAPVLRLGAPFVPTPQLRSLDALVRPRAQDVIEAAQRLLEPVARA